MRVLFLKIQCLNNIYKRVHVLYICSAHVHRQDNVYDDVKETSFKERSLMYVYTCYGKLYHMVDAS